MPSIYFRVACPNFGHNTLSSELYNYTLITEFEADVGMLRKNHHSKAETVYYQFLQTYILVQKNERETWHI